MNKKILLHSCCACCASVAIERLASGYEVSCLFYNPNIHPEEEYIIRLQSMKKICADQAIPLIVAEYRPAEFLENVKGREMDPERGERCGICFRIRLTKTAEITAKSDFQAFATTLTLSPHKDAELINSIGESIGSKTGVNYVPTNLKKKDGYKRSIALSHEHGLYRQTYCGCTFSLRDSTKRGLA